MVSREICKRFAIEIPRDRFRGGLQGGSTVRIQTEGRVIWVVGGVSPQRLAGKKRREQIRGTYPTVLLLASFRYFLFLPDFVS